MKLSKEQKRLLLPGLCVVGSLLLYMGLTFFSKGESEIVGNRLERGGYGDGSSVYEVEVDGLLEEPVDLTVEVGPRIYTEKEAERVFEKIMEGMEEKIRGKNPSLMEVREDLKLPSRWEDSGVRLLWYSEDPEWISATGKIEKTVEEPQNVQLQVHMSAGKYQAEYLIFLRLMPVIQTDEEALKSGLIKEIASREENAQSEPWMELPETYEGRRLTYRKKEENLYAVIPILGVVMAVLLFSQESAEQKKKEKLREKELLMDYAELVSKLMVLIGAGLTVRSAWERMVRDYESALDGRRIKRRVAYEEMRQTSFEIANGISESVAFREFGRRCGVQQYLKLSSLLEQNRRSGMKNLRAILTAEMEDAFEARKNLARTMGEEAGTKLLAPLFMMLGIVMVMIMVPAMMSMG
ncbi:hypothetical protein [Brotaphodocola sp.]|uniref:hypothetical protein n=1 Tax=Brotaphodocola sp. TaxID=3073577 RepID=UPI003D7D8CDD